MKLHNPAIRLHIIGITESELPDTTGDKNRTRHGYLHKDKTDERDLYYNQLLSAKLSVKPATQWGGYSSTIEAMLYGCPVIVSPYDDFVANFGTDINFGTYHQQAKLADEISDIFNMSTSDCVLMAKNRADRVKDYTWDNYVTAFLEDLKSQDIDLLN